MKKMNKQIVIKPMIQIEKFDINDLGSMSARHSANKFLIENTLKKKLKNSESIEKEKTLSINQTNNTIKHFSSNTDDKGFNFLRNFLTENPNKNNEPIKLNKKININSKVPSANLNSSKKLQIKISSNNKPSLENTSNQYSASKHKTNSLSKTEITSRAKSYVKRNNTSIKNISNDNLNANTPKSPAFQNKINSSTSRFVSDIPTKELVSSKYSEKSFSSKKIDVSNMYFTSTYLKTSPTYKQAIHKIIFQKSDTKYIKFLDEEVSRNKNRSRSILKSSVIEKSASTYKKTDPMTNLTKEESIPEFLLTTKSANDNKKLLFSKKKFNTTTAIALTSSNLDIFKSKNINLIDSKYLNVVKYLKEIRLIKHWRNFTRYQNFSLKRKALGNNFLFSKQTPFKNIFKGFTEQYNRSFNFFNINEMKLEKIVFGDSQIQSFIPFFSLYWNNYNDEMKNFLRQIHEFLLNLNNSLIKEIENQKSFFNLAQINKNKYKGNELKTIESILKYKTQTFNFLITIFEKIVKLVMMSIKSSNLFYFDIFLNVFRKFFQEPERFKHEFYFSISNDKTLVLKPTYESFSKRIEEFLKIMLNDFSIRNPIISFKDKCNFLLSNPYFKKNLPVVIKILENKVFHREKLILKISSIQKIINDLLHNNIKKINNVVAFNEKEVRKLIEIKEFSDKINVENFEFDKMNESFFSLENYNLKINDKYESSMFIFDFGEIKNFLQKTREKILNTIEDKFGKIIVISNKFIKEKLKGIPLLFEKFFSIKNNFSKQSETIVDICKEENLIKKNISSINKIKSFMSDKLKINVESKNEMNEVMNVLEGFSKKITSILDSLYSSLNSAFIKEEVAQIETKIKDFQAKIKIICSNKLIEENFKEFKLVSHELAKKGKSIQEDISTNLKRILIFSKEQDLIKLPISESDFLISSDINKIQIKEDYILVKEFLTEIIRISFSYNENYKIYNTLLLKFESLQMILTQIDEILNTSKQDIIYQTIYEIFCKLNNYVVSDLNINSSLFENDRNAIISMINKKIKPIINFLYYHNFNPENDSSDERILLKEFEGLSSKSIISRIMYKNDTILNFEDSFLNFKREIIKIVSDANNLQDLNNFIKQSEKLFYQFKISFSKLLLTNKFTNLLFGNKLETCWIKSFEQFEYILNIISDFCDLNYTFELKKDKVKQIIDVIGRNEDEGNIKDLTLNLEKKQEETLLFVIKNAIYLYVTSFDVKVLEYLKVFLTEKIISLNKVLLFEKDFMNKIKSKYPKLLILEDSEILKFYWLILNPVKSNFDLINTYYYKLTNNQMNLEEISDEENNEFIVSGINGRGNDFLKFKNLIQFSLDVPCFLLEVEAEIEYSLKYNLIESLNNFSKMEFNEWICSSNLQVIVSDLYLIFTNEVSQLLITQNKADESKNDSSISAVKRSMKNYSENLHKLSDVSSNDKLGNYMKKIDQTNAINKAESDLKEIIAKYYQWIEQLEILLKSGSNELNTKYYIVQNILITLFNQKEILEFLLKNKILDVNSYEWLKNIRHIWDSQNKEVVIECGGWSIFQHYNYIGNYERLLLTPQTDKIYLFFASCFREKSSTIIKTNISQDGYYEIFEEFANNLWIQIRKVYLSECSLYKKMTTLFDICTNTNNWIYLENLSELEDQSILYVSKMMQMIQQEIILDEIKNVEVSNQKEMKKMFCVVGCIRLSEKSKEIDMYLKSSCRIMNLMTPEISVFTKGIMKLFISKQNKYDSSHETMYQYLDCFQNIIKQKVNSFYFDFHVLNLMKNFLINRVIDNNVFNVNPNDLLNLMIKGIIEFLIDILIGLDIKHDEIKAYFSKNNRNNINFDHIKTDLLNFLEDKLENKHLSGIMNSFDMVISEQNVKKIHYFYNSLINNNKISLIYGGYGCGKSKTIENVINLFIQAQSKNIKVVYLKEVLFVSNLNHITEILNMLYENEYDKNDLILLILENFENTEVCNMVLSVYNDFFNIKNLKKFRLIIEKHHLKNIDFSLFSMCNLIYLENINWRKLQKYFLNNIKLNLKSMNILINDEFYTSLLEFTRNVLIHFFTENNEKFLYFKIILLYNYIDLFLKKVLLKKIIQTPKNFLFNIFIQCLIFILYENTKNLRYPEIIKFFQSTVKTYFKSDVTQDFLNEFKSDNEVYLDYDSLIFKRLDAVMNITPANEIMLFSKKEYSALYLMEVSYQSKSPFIIFGETVFGNNSVIKTFLRKHSNNNKIYTLVENSPISDVNDLKNKEVIIYLEDVNLDSTNIKVTSILDYYCKENRYNSSFMNKPDLNNNEMKALIIGDSLNTESQFQNSLLYKVNRLSIKNEEEYVKIFQKMTISELKNKKFSSINIKEKLEKYYEILYVFFNKFEYLFSKNIELSHIICFNNFIGNIELLKMTENKSLGDFIRLTQSLFYTTFYAEFKGQKIEQPFHNFVNEFEFIKEDELLTLSTANVSSSFYIKKVPGEYKNMTNYKAENLFGFYSTIILSTVPLKSFVSIICNKDYFKCFLDVNSVKCNLAIVRTCDYTKFLADFNLNLINNSRVILFRIKGLLSSKMKSVFKIMFKLMSSSEGIKMNVLNAEDEDINKFINICVTNDMTNCKLIFSFESYEIYLLFRNEFIDYRNNNLVLELESSIKLLKSILNNKLLHNDLKEKDNLIEYFDSFDRLLDKKFYESLSFLAFNNSFDFLNMNKMFPNYNVFRDYINNKRYKVMYYYIKFINFFYEYFSSLGTMQFPLNSIATVKSNSNSSAKPKNDENIFKELKTEVENQQKAEMDTKLLKSDEKKKLLLSNISELEDLFISMTDSEYSKTFNDYVELKDLKTINDFLQYFLSIEIVISQFQGPNNKLNFKQVYSSKTVLITIFKMIASLRLTKSQLDEMKSKHKNDVITFSKFFSKNVNTKSPVVKNIHNIVKIIFHSVFGEESLFYNNYITSYIKEKSNLNEVLLDKLKKNNFDLDDKKLTKNISTIKQPNEDNLLITFDLKSIFSNIIGDCLILSSLLIFENDFSFDFIREISQNIIYALKKRMISYTPEIQTDLEKVIMFYYKTCFYNNSENLSESARSTKLIRRMFNKIKEDDSKKCMIKRKVNADSSSRPYNLYEHKKNESSFFKHFTDCNDQLKYLLLNITEKELSKDFETDFKLLVESERSRPFFNQAHDFFLTQKTENNNLNYLIESGFNKLKQNKTFSILKSYFVNIEKSKYYIEIKSFFDSVNLYRKLTNEICNKPSFYINDFCSLYYYEKLYNSITPEQLAKKIYESIFFNVEKKFLLNSLITIDFLRINKDISVQEHSFLIAVLECNLKTNNYKCIQSLKHFNNEILSSVKQLLAHYKQNENNNLEIIIILDLIIRGFDIYVIRTKIEGIKKKSKKLILLAIFQEEDFFSMLKYLINKNLFEKYNVEKNKLNDFLNKKTYKAPILVKSEVFVNITNFLCSLASYYETEFIIIRNIEYIENSSFLKYNYIVDNNYKKAIVKCYKEGGWLLISCGINLEKILKIFNFYKEKPHNNFRLFIDANLVENSKDCQDFLSNYSHIVYIDSVCVDELEAAHDVWVNILEEKLISETMIDESITENRQHENNLNDINDVSTFSNFMFQAEGSHKEGKSYISEMKDIKFLTDELENKI